MFRPISNEHCLIANVLCLKTPLCLYLLSHFGPFVTAQDLLSHECGTWGITCHEEHSVEISDTNRRFLL